jgi:hypothetical protein
MSHQSQHNCSPSNLQDRMLFRMSLSILLPSEPLIFTIVKSASQLSLSSTSHVAHIVWSKEVVKQQQVGVPSIRSMHSRVSLLFIVCIACLMDKKQECLPQMLDMMSQTFHLSFTKAHPVYGAWTAISWSTVS